MKKVLTATMLLMVLVALPLSHLLMADGKLPNVKICHKGYIIVANGHGAVNGHLGHGDCARGGIAVPAGDVGDSCECKPVRG